MKCPHFMDERTHEAAQCVEAIAPFEPSAVNRIQWCLSSRHRHCALYRHANGSLSSAIEQEVARAIG